MPSKLHPEDFASASPLPAASHDTKTPHIFNGATSPSEKPAPDRKDTRTNRQRLEDDFERMKYGKATHHDQEKQKHEAESGSAEGNEDDREIWHDAVEYQDSDHEKEKEKEKGDTGEGKGKGEGGNGYEVVGKEGYSGKAREPITSRWDPRFIERA